MKGVIRLLAIALLLLPTTIFAAEFRGDQNNTVTLGADETARNLYIAGGNVDINGKTVKDLVAGGANISMNGSVEDDLIAAGGNIFLRGPVGGNARIAGGTIVVENTIGDDLIVGSGNIRISSSANINGDLVLAATDSDVAGKVGGNVYAIGENIIISGQVGGNVTIKGAKSVTIKDGAVIGGKLDYVSEKEASIAGGAQIRDGVEFEQMARSSYGEGIAWKTVLWNTLTGMIMLLLLVLLFPRLAQYVADDFWKIENLGWGLVALIVTPIIAVILLVSMVLWKIGLIIGLLYAASLILSSIFVPLLFGTLVTKYITRFNAKTVSWVEVVIGGVVAGLISLIPRLGGLVIFIALVLVLGSLSNLVARNMKR